MLIFKYLQCLLAFVAIKIQNLKESVKLLIDYKRLIKLIISINIHFSLIKFLEKIAK